jgi:hypothetical protein
VRDLLLHRDALRAKAVVEVDDRLQVVDAPRHLMGEFGAVMGGAPLLQHELVMLLVGTR